MGCTSRQTRRTGLSCLPCDVSFEPVKSALEHLTQAQQRGVRLQAGLSKADCVLRISPRDAERCVQDRFVPGEIERSTVRLHEKLTACPSVGRVLESRPAAHLIVVKGDG